MNVWRVLKRIKLENQSERIELGQREQINAAAPPSKSKNCIDDLLITRSCLHTDAGQLRAFFKLKF